MLEPGQTSIISSINTEICVHCGGSGEEDIKIFKSPEHSVKSAASLL